ncbi:hypothetical protein ABPG72_002692 [Tetrahymena utriculariae]
MFVTSLNSLFKFTQKIPKCFCNNKYQRFSSLTREVLKVKMDLFYSQDQVKQFIVNQNQNLKQIENLLKDDNPDIKNVKFLVGDQEIENKEEQLFLNLSINNDLKIIIDDIQTTFEFADQLNTANYFESTKLEGELAQHEVPYQDAQVIQAFIKNFKQILEKQKPSSQAYSEKQMNDALLKAVQTFSEYNFSSSFEKNTQFVNALRQQYQEGQDKLQKIEDESRSKSLSNVKQLIGLQVVQFGFLFYLTYGLYGWDFAEPVSYVLGLGSEAYILYHFIKHRKSFNQLYLFEKQLQPVRKNLISQNQTNTEGHLKFLKCKLDMIQSKIQFGRSKEK